MNSKNKSLEMPKTALRGFELLIDKVCDNNKAVLTTT